MASAVPNSALARILSEYISGKDIRARLVMTNTTCDTEVDAINNLSNYTTIDPCDATGYADLALAGETASADDTNDRGEFDATDLSFTGLSGNASRAIQGVLLYEYVDGTNANDIPLAYIEFSSTIPATATQIDVPWNAEGILQLS